ncbi:hypothetical protein L211DRAFT_393211 [Terfezia boudieri ATCC MYA-4762]|uniref:Uncharacterized protein n=1 Tax=Terfezia boudieri ATCC MYA-4762 TaxID=1051890 RepID=A0A3N4M066_9PEZI|nr:hypothetical protein L211DRAFT_393211 [Terfezia boudieri ATCC MYA-4762]
MNARAHHKHTINYLFISPTLADYYLTWCQTASPCCGSSAYTSCTLLHLYLLQLLPGLVRIGLCALYSISPHCTTEPIRPGANYTVLTYIQRLALLVHSITAACIPTVLFQASICISVHCVQQVEYHSRIRTCCASPFAALLLFAQAQVLCTVPVTRSFTYIA